MTVEYRDAGVDIGVADEVTARLAARFETGLFGGFVPVSSLKQYHNPVLVSSIDGIGTKVRLARRLGRLDGLGLDIVHHCVNDIAVHGAKPLFFLDYLAFNRVDAAVVEKIVSAMARACGGLGIALAGGETAEMPSVYAPGEMDIAGAIVGAAEGSRIVDGRTIVEGDVVLGLASSGLHTNGYSLVQHVLTDRDYDLFDPELGMTLGEALLEPHRCYLTEIQRLVSTEAVHGMAHVTGGGIAGNLSRIVPAGLQAVIELPSPPRMFRHLAERGVSLPEMRRVFNLGIGLVAVCGPEIVEGLSEEITVIGRIEEAGSSERKVVFSGD